jgi:hypothetical protein
MKTYNGSLGSVFRGKGYKAQILKIIGISRKQVLDWFYFQMFLCPSKGMTFSNYGNLWEIDHIKPVSGFDLTLSTDLKACYHWSNLRPLPCIENNCKGPRLTQESLGQHNDILKLYCELNSLPVIQLNMDP